ncbi:MAG: glutamate--cysteine ligase [Betaproteobacteria bacterium]|nr:glutamate--cysteine ligase [Betaproteobacteria bacterium]
MGKEIAITRFTAEDFLRARERLAAETKLLGEELAAGKFSAGDYVAGFELEAWIIDRNYYPAPINEPLFERVASALVVPELSRFNIEVNGASQHLSGRALSVLHAELEATWKRCLEAANELEAWPIVIGILPTIAEKDLCLANMSPRNRFFALNQQVLKQRHGEPLHIHIEGHERLELDHRDVMLEAATTSFQLHLQVPADRVPRYYNASVIAAAPLVAASANSPFLFGRALWEKTRIPLFEQAIEIGGYGGLEGSEVRRVTLGTGYLKDSAFEPFVENLNTYPVLLPTQLEEPARHYPHLRLHNGTIWRWVRPLVGFGEDGTRHIRIEQRVIPSGPTLVDQMANAALYYGLARHLADLPQAPERALPFKQARENFYAAATHGLEAELVWLDGHRIPATTLLLEELVPRAHEGLLRFGLERADAERYLGILAARVRTGQTGAAWQRAHAERHGRDFLKLTADYLHHQRRGEPVHEKV